MNAGTAFVMRLVCALLIAGPAAVAAQSGPPMPQHLEGYCEGESCHYACQAVVRAPITLRAGDREAAALVGRLRIGDTVTAVTGNLWIRQPGIVVLLRDTVLATDDGVAREDTLRLARGDTVFVLEYRELGAWAWWYRGRRGGGTEFWNGPAQVYFGRGRDHLAAGSSRAPVTEHWVRLERRDGLAGWWRVVADGLEPLAAEDPYCAVQR